MPKETKGLMRTEMSAQGERRALDVLMEAQHAWDGMEPFRRERERNKRYSYGDQWDDYITVDGERMREDTYIRKQGNVPLKNNIIRKLERTVLGVFRNQDKEPTCVARDRDEQKQGEVMSTALQYNMQLNRMNELYARGLEEFMISGFVVHRKWFGWRNDKLDCWTDSVQPNNFFIDSNMRDMRGWDCTLVGEVHDVDWNTLCEQYAKTPADVSRLRQIYAYAHDMRSIADTLNYFGYEVERGYDFLYSHDPTRCRVIEVWRKENKARYRCHDMNTGELFKVDIEDKEELVDKVNRERLAQGRAAGMADDDIPLIESEWFVDNYWYYYYLSPFGDILDEGETPYKHKSHPYVFKAYPFIDGEVHGFVSDFIDQQRYINRLITMYDWIMRASAKGVLIFPEDCLPEGLNINDIADEWARFNGVIVIKKGAKNLPQQVANNAVNIGINELLNIQLKLIEDISGVNGSLQGKPGYSGMSAALYSQQTQNATTTLTDLLESYSAFIEDAAYKDVKNIQQFYDSKRLLNVVGRSASQIVYDPDKISDVEFDLSIIESTTTPAYRAMANDFLMQIWQTGQITLEQLLENGDFPFADQLLQSIKSQQEQMQQGQQPQPLPQGLQQQVQQGADMEAVNRAQQMLMPR
jgi:hypothetical protein|nr:MAG TPA: portal protein [Caudoviricetes sp.]